LKQDVSESEEVVAYGCERNSGGVVVGMQTINSHIASTDVSVGAVQNKLQT
jgi:hypothetical protein